MCFQALGNCGLGLSCHDAFATLGKAERAKTYRRVSKDEEETTRNGPTKAAELRWRTRVLLKEEVLQS
jgi:hypothetical protein